MCENFPYRVRNRPLARLNHSLLKHVNVLPLLKTVCFPNTLFKATPQKKWEICVFPQNPPYGSSATTRDGTRYFTIAEQQNVTTTT